MTDSSREWWSSVNAALAVGKPMATSVDQFNLACNHIAGLLQDASRLLESGSHATSTSLSITALEETSKIHIGTYRKSAEAVKRSKDPLYKHGEKHRIAVGPTVSMGSRLQSAIGQARMNELIELARSGGLIGIRESALYAEQQDENLSVPRDVISPSMGRELLLLAVEAFDDGLFDYTTYSNDLSNRTDAIFARWKGA